MEEFDLAVIGGGPAGSTLATLVARQGHRVALLERETGPRYRVGESLLPATIFEIATLLGAAEELKAAGFIVKRGATFCWGDRRDEAWTLPFGGDETLLDATAPTAFNVSRSAFDEILLRNAARRGVTVFRGADVHQVADQDEAGRREVRLRQASGEGRMNARFVANATGQVRFAAPGLEARQHSRFFRKVAVWSYWENAARLPAPLSGNVFFETTPTEAGDAWLWFIPISDRITSIGIVAPREFMAQIRQDRRAALETAIAGAPRTLALLAGAVPASAAPYDEVRSCADYSYASETFWVPGMFNVGDAACFVDVLLSSGVHLATYGAMLAARSVGAVLRGEIAEAPAMNEFESRLRQEYAVFYAGLTGLYEMDQPREHYGPWLRRLLQRSNGVRLEWHESPDNPGGLNADLAPPPQGSPEARAAHNVEVMRRFNAYQLGYDGPPRSVDPAALPALRNALAVVEGGWRLPAALAVTA